MTGAPPLAVRIDRRGAWQAGVGLLGGLAIAALLGWWLARPAPAPGWVTALALAGCVGAAACAASLLRVGAAVGLRWDARQWWHACGAREPVAGELGVAIDLGDWMLLRFVPLGGSAWLAARWIPVQRRGLESVWHALRCAVHAQRPDESAAT
jgi:hypothetical protein